jgi:hypothetical protein
MDSFIYAFHASFASFIESSSSSASGCCGLKLPYLILFLLVLKKEQIVMNLKDPIGCSEEHFHEIVHRFLLHLNFYPLFAIDFSARCRGSRSHQIEPKPRPSVRSVRAPRALTLYTWQHPAVKFGLMIPGLGPRITSDDAARAGRVTIQDWPPARRMIIR